MKRFLFTLPLAALSLVLLAPARAQDNSMPDQGNDRPLRGAREAMRMVPARATLESSINADKDAPGTQFRVRLSKSVRLDNGMKLPKGTVLLGQIANDDMGMNGNAKLALRITEAVMHDGQTVPVKATIVGIYTPGKFIDEGPYTEQIPNSWNDGTLAVDEVNVIHGVDLHSRIASHNSGVLVATRDRTIHVPTGSEFALAIAPRGRMQETGVGGY